MKTGYSVIDHLVYASPTLVEGIDALEGLLGVRAAVGGRHLAWGTQNALLSLGPQVYLEVMAPDEAPIDGGKPRPFGLDTLKTPRLVTWAVRADNLNRVKKVADGRQVDLGEVREGRRQRPDGVLLQWEMTDLTKDRMGGALPFYINWGKSPHPAVSAPKGCILRVLRIFHPEADQVNAHLAAFGIEFTVDRGPSGMVAGIETPNGFVELK